MKTQLEAITALVQQGLYQDNLTEILRCCRDIQVLSEPESCSVPLFVLEQVIARIQAGLDEQAVPVEDLEAIENQLRAPILKLVRAVSEGSSSDQISACAELIRGFRELRA